MQTKVRIKQDVHKTHNHKPLFHKTQLPTEKYNVFETDFLVVPLKVNSRIPKHSLCSSKDIPQGHPSLHPAIFKALPQTLTVIYFHNL